MVRDPKCLCGNRQRRIDSGRRRKEGRVDNKQVFVVERSAEWIECSGLRIVAESNCPALVRD
jgi:hypothetical protein